MIIIENISNNIVKIAVPVKIQDDDFQKISPVIEPLITQYGKIRLLADATKFNGWENVAAFERHVKFVRNYHLKVERIAVIAGHLWQHWVISIVRMFVHPEIKIFDKGEEVDAERWVKEE